MPSEKKRRKPKTRAETKGPLDRGAPFSVWLTLGLALRADERAKSEGLNRSEFVAKAIERELNRPAKSAA